MVISSVGALVKFNDTYIYKAEFSVEETRELIKMARYICGAECEITLDTADDVIGDNNHNGIADYLKNAVLERNS